MRVLDLLITVLLFGHVVSASFINKTQSLQQLCSWLTGKEEMSLICRARYSHLICYHFSFIPLNLLFYCSFLLAVFAFERTSKTVAASGDI